MTDVEHRLIIDNTKWATLRDSGGFTRINKEHVSWIELRSGALAATDRCDDLWYLEIGIGGSSKIFRFEDKEEARQAEAALMDATAW